MRKSIIAVTFIAASLVAAPSARSQMIPPPMPPAFQMFYDGLAPHGSWLYLPVYGWCWQPRVEAGWVPYTHGHWELTEAGWTWVSDYPWGWAAFHYGGWIYDGSYAWLWVPDVLWAPAWVEWRSGGGYIGWAPLPPRGVTTARPVTVAYPPHRWTFVTGDRFLAPVRPVTIAQPIWARTQPIRDVRTVGGVRVFAGPTIAHVETRVGRPIQQRTLTDVHRATPIWSPRAPVERPIVRPPVPNRQPVRPAPRPIPARPKVSQRDHKHS